MKLPTYLNYNNIYISKQIIITRTYLLHFRLLVHYILLSQSFNLRDKSARISKIKSFMLVYLIVAPIYSY